MPAGARFRPATHAQNRLYYDRTLRRALTSLALLAGILALLPAGMATAQAPAGIDQYLPSPPGGQPGGEGATGNAGGLTIGGGGDAPEPGAPQPGSSQGAEAGDAAGGSDQGSGTGDDGGGGGEVGAPEPTAGADDSTVPIAGYPATELVLGILALLVAAIAARLAYAGYQRAQRSSA